MSQGAVWQEVAVLQDKLADNLGVEVAYSPVSPSSLQLSLENDQVNAAVDVYLDKLVSIIDDEPTAVGFVFAINGEINSADVYASRELFRKLWPKLLKASATEALTALKDDKQLGDISREAVRAFLAEADQGKRSDTSVTDRINLITKETDDILLFETVDTRNKGGWVHRNYIKK